MATMNITVNANTVSMLTFSVTSELSNSCKTIWTLTVTSSVSIGDTLHVFVDEVVGGYILTCNDPSYVYDTDYVSTVKNQWTLEIENSGIPGTYRSCTVNITDVTTGAVTGANFVRYNDGGIC
jgi:hypothetical protein